MYFLQKDDIMLHFTLSGFSDITGCQCLQQFILIEISMEMRMAKFWKAKKY